MCLFVSTSHQEWMKIRGIFLSLFWRLCKWNESKYKKCLFWNWLLELMGSCFTVLPNVMIYKAKAETLTVSALWILSVQVFNHRNASHWALTAMQLHKYMGIQAWETTVQFLWCMLMTFENFEVLIQFKSQKSTWKLIQVRLIQIIQTAFAVWRSLHRFIMLHLKEKRFW